MIEEVAGTPRAPSGTDRPSRRAAYFLSPRVGRRFAQTLGMFLIHATDVPGHARGRLVDGLQRLARAFGTPSIVVFDGAPSPELPNGFTRGAVRVLYRGDCVSAGERIVDLVEQKARTHGITVITSDRVLAERVRRRGAHVAPTFLLRRALAHVYGETGYSGRSASTMRSRPARLAS